MNQEDFDGIVFDVIKVEKNIKIKIESRYKELSNLPVSTLDSVGNVLKGCRDYVYTLIKIQLTNLNIRPYSILESGFKLIDNEGNQYEHVTVDWSVKDSIFTNGYIDNAHSIMPNGNIKTILIFPEVIILRRSPCQ